jgi:hypothetical protein
MHLASETISEGLAEANRTGGRHAVSALWMEAVARGQAETTAALAELWDNMTDVAGRSTLQAVVRIGDE